MMKKCKLTILKTMLNEDMAKEHKDMAICDRSDDLRLVIIKVERTGEVSEV